MSRIKMTNTQRKNQGFFTVHRISGISSTQVNNMSQQPTQMHLVNSHDVISAPNIIEVEINGINEFDIGNVRFSNFGLVSQRLADDNQINAREYKFEEYDESLYKILMDKRQIILDKIKQYVESPGQIHHGTILIQRKAWSVFLLKILPKIKIPQTE